MGLEFSFDDISLDQQVSRDQLEIDLYDELITISDAEPDEQVRMLAARPAAVVSHQENDKPESIRVTGSLGRERIVAETPAMPASAIHEQASIPAAGPPLPLPLPASPRKSAPLPSAFPPAADPGNTPLSMAYRPAPDPSPNPSKAFDSPQPSNGQKPVPVQPVPPRPMSAEPPAPVEWPSEPAPRQARPQPPVPTPVFQAPPAPSRSAPLPPIPPKAAPAPVVAGTSTMNRCPDCGQPAGDLDLICIECGGFIG